MKEQLRRTRAGLPALLLSSLLIVSCASKTGVTEMQKVRFIETPDGMTAELPAGEEFDVRLLDSLSSKTTKVGDRFRAETVLPVTSNGRTLIPEGSPVTGEVAKVKGPKMGLLKGKVELRFDEVMLEGRSVPIDAEIGLDISDLTKKAGKSAGQSIAKEIAKRVFPLTGPVFMAIDVGKGVKYVFFTDKDVTIEAGSEMEITLQKPAIIPLTNGDDSVDTPSTGGESIPTPPL